MRAYRIRLSPKDRALLREISAHQKQSVDATVSAAIHAKAQGIWPYFCESCEKRSETGKGWMTDSEGVQLCRPCYRGLLKGGAS